MTYFYLYLKKHLITNKLYLGYTKKNPFVYKGSGIYWKKHLKLHGNHVNTTILYMSQNNSDIKKYGKYYSNKWNIIKNPEFCNLTIEEGAGGDTSKTKKYILSLEKRKISSRKKRWYNNGIKNVHCEHAPQGFYPGRLSFNNTGAKIGAAIIKEKQWYNNGLIEKMFFKTESIPDDFVRGRLDKTNKFKRFYSSKGTKWYNNGIEEIMTSIPPTNSWNLGRLKRR